MIDLRFVWISVEHLIPFGWLPRRERVTGISVHDWRVWTARVFVLMPERPIPATACMFESTWSWPRLRRTRMETRARITPDRPVPVPGKGENSWDCDDDGIYGMTCVAATPQEAAATLARSALRDRERYG